MYLKTTSIYAKTVSEVLILIIIETTIKVENPKTTISIGDPPLEIKFYQVCVLYLGSTRSI